MVGGGVGGGGGIAAESCQQIVTNMVMVVAHMGLLGGPVTRGNTGDTGEFFFLILVLRARREERGGWLCDANVKACADICGERVLTHKDVTGVDKKRQRHTRVQVHQNGMNRIRSCSLMGIWCCIAVVGHRDKNKT